MFSSNSDALHLGPGLLHLPEFPGSPGLEAPRTNTLFLSQLFHPAPRPSLSLPLLCHPAGNLFPPHLPTTGSSGLGPRRLGPWFASVSQSRRIYRAWIWGYLELMISEVSLSLWSQLCRFSQFFWINAILGFLLFNLRNSCQCAGWAPSGRADTVETIY